MPFDFLKRKKGDAGGSGDGTGSSSGVGSASSGSWPFTGRLMTPRCSNCQATGVSEPPDLEKIDRISDAVRFRLSVMAATITATLAGPKPS